MAITHTHAHVPAAKDTVSGSVKTEARGNGETVSGDQRKTRICVPQCAEDQKNIAELVNYLGTMYYR